MNPKSNALPPSRPAEELPPTPVEMGFVPAPPVPTVSLTMEQLQAIVSTAVAAAVQAGSPNSGTEIGNAIAAAMAKNGPRRKVSIGEYDPKTFVQPDKTKTMKLRRLAFQNGGIMDHHVLSNPEIDLLNRITHSGRYINRMVEVIVAANGSEEEVYLRYNNRTRDQMLNNQRLWHSLEHMLQQIVDQQEVEDKEAAETASAVAELRRRSQSARGEGLTLDAAR